MHEIFQLKDNYINGSGAMNNCVIFLMHYYYSNKYYNIKIITNTIFIAFFIIVIIKYQIFYKLLFNCIITIIANLFKLN